MKRRKWIQVAASGILGGGLYATNIEPRWLDVTHTTIRLPKLRDRLRLVHLSDLHSSPEVPTSLLLDAAREAIAQKPDLICLTGDYVSNFIQHDEEGLRATFRLLLTSAPVYAVAGNHDSGRWGNSWHTSEPIRRVLESSGVMLLHNRWVTVEPRDGAKISLAGTGDLWNYEEFEPDASFAGIDASVPVVVLAHNPDSKDAMTGHPWDLMLSGHTHGGQVLLPFVEPSWLPVADHRFVAGRYDWQGRQLYITRGVGSVKGVRFRCRPEVSVLNLEPAESLESST